jgi:putative transposase
MIRGIIFPTTHRQRPRLQHRAESPAAGRHGERVKPEVGWRHHRRHCRSDQWRNNGNSGRGRYEPDQKTIRGIVFPAIGIYLAVIIDLFSRRVVGWAISNRMTQDLALRALNMAIRVRRPPPGCIHHTDRGSQYCAHDYQKLLRKHGFKVSMSGKGNCYDNAAVETFFKTIKAEMIWRRSWQTRWQAEMAIFQYINGFCNPRRKHSALGWKSPVVFEQWAA